MRTGFISRILGKHDKIQKQVLLDFLEEISEERDLLSQLFETMTEGVLVFDHERRLRFANPRAGQLLDIDPVQCLDKEASSFLQDEAIRKPLIQSLHTGRPVVALETATLTRDGPRALRIDTLPVDQSGKRFKGTLVFLRDVTEEKQRDSERRENKRLAALATLSASLAHEIRNPLNSMGIHAQLLERKARREGDEESLESLKVIGEEIRSLNEKLSGFLEAARPRKPQFASVSLHGLLEETLALMRPELEAAGIAPEYYPPSVHTTVFADRADLRQAFVNVLKNAIEAMGSGGHLKIRVLEGDSTVTILFEDTGSGIDPEILDRIYEIGFSTKDVGSGLGLAQVDRCVREHFGTLNIESKPGKGTTVRIALPVLTQGKRLLEMAPPPRALAAAPADEKPD